MFNLQNVPAKIKRLNSRGIGVGVHEDGSEVFEIPYSLPEETIEFTCDAAGKLVHIDLKTASPDRRKPLCPHFEKCGGCSLQHASKKFVTEWKESIVCEALSKKRLFPKFRSTFVTPNGSRRRAVFSGRRTKKGTIVGFNAPRSNKIVSIVGCIILNAKIITFLPGMEEMTALGCTRSSIIKIHISLSENGLDVFVKGGKPMERELRIKLTKLALKWNLARLTWEDDLIISIDPPIQLFGNIKVTPPEKFFIQATKEAENLMVNDVCDSLRNEKSVVDLFAGLGTFALPLSKTSEVFAFEQSSEMLTALNNASGQTPELKAIKTQSRNLQKNPVSKNELSKFGGAVLNPPRVGSHAQCKQLAISSVKTIVLVSCNPDTFATDAEILIRGGYNLDWVRVIDQFRWSHHIEVIANFSRN